MFLCPSHEDTKIIENWKLNFAAYVGIKCSKTDTFIIMLGNIDKLRSDVKILMKFGLGNV